MAYTDEQRSEMKRVHMAVDKAVNLVMPIDLESYFVAMAYRYVSAAIQGGLTEEDMMHHTRAVYRAAKDTGADNDDG